VRPFCEQWGSLDTDVRTFWRKKRRIFLKSMVCPHGQGGRGQYFAICADVLYGRTVIVSEMLWCPDQEPPIVWCSVENCLSKKLYCFICIHAYTLPNIWTITALLHACMPSLPTIFSFQKSLMSVRVVGAAQLKIESPHITVCHHL